MATEKNAEKVIKPNEAQLDALAQFIRVNMEIVKSEKSGKFYVTLAKHARRGEFGGIDAGRIDFCAMSLTDAGDAAANRLERAKSQVNSLSAEEKQALLAELL
jgi:hypothetical protein